MLLDIGMKFRSRIKYAHLFTHEKRLTAPNITKGILLLVEMCVKIYDGYYYIFCTQQVFIIIIFYKIN